MAVVDNYEYTDNYAFPTGFTKTDPRDNERIYRMSRSGVSTVSIISIFVNRVLHGTKTIIERLEPAGRTFEKGVQFRT